MKIHSYKFTPISLVLWVSKPFMRFTFIYSQFGLKFQGGFLGEFHFLFWHRLIWDIFHLLLLIWTKVPTFGSIISLVFPSPTSQDWLKFPHSYPWVSCSRTSQLTILLQAHRWLPWVFQSIFTSSFISLQNYHFLLL